MSSNNDTIKNGVIDYGICCDECGYEIEAGVTGYWRDGVTGIWIDVRYCGICVWDFVNQPKRLTAHDIWRRQEEREQEEEVRRKKNAALNKQESARLQKKEQDQEEDWGSTQDPFLEELKEQSEEVMELLREEEDRIENSRLTCEYMGQEEQDPRYDYDSLQSKEKEESYDWIQAHANKFWSPPPTTVSCDGELSRSYDWDPKPERRACREILDREILDREILDREILDDKDSSPLDDDHLQKINALQPKNLEVLSDYANLCEISLLDAYHYKSRCHLYSCNKPLDPDYWDAEQNVQFCCRRHGEYFEDCGHVEEDIDCKVCYSRPHQNYLPHQKNLVSYRALKQSNQGLGPIVSAICVFDELCMSNILFDSLVDLCEFY